MTPAVPVTGVAAIGPEPMAVIGRQQLRELIEALKLARYALKYAPLRVLGSTDNWRIAAAIDAALKNIEEERQ